MAHGRRVGTRCLPCCLLGERQPLSQFPEHKAHSAASLAERRDTAPWPSVAAWQRSCGWEARGERPAGAPGVANPQRNILQCCHLLPLYPGPGTPAGTAGPSQGSHQSSLWLLLAARDEQGPAEPAHSSAGWKSRTAQQERSQPEAGGELGCSPHALRKAAARREAGKGMCCPCCAWEYLLMPQECGYVMASPPHALPLPRGNPPARRGWGAS